MLACYRPFKFIGTNAYWLASLNTDADINNTIHDIASRGISVIRTWAFNGTRIAPSSPYSSLSDCSFPIAHHRQSRSYAIPSTDLTGCTEWSMHCCQFINASLPV